MYYFLIKKHITINNWKDGDESSFRGSAYPMFKNEILTQNPEEIKILQ